MVLIFLPGWFFFFLRYLENGFWASPAFCAFLVSEKQRTRKSSCQEMLRGGGEWEGRCFRRDFSHVLQWNHLLCLHLFRDPPPPFSFYLALVCPRPLFPLWFDRFWGKGCRVGGSVCAATWVCVSMYAHGWVRGCVRAPVGGWAQLVGWHPKAECLLLSTLSWSSGQYLGPLSVACSHVLVETGRERPPYTGEFQVGYVSFLRKKALGTGGVDEGSRKC